MNRRSTLSPPPTRLLPSICEYREIESEQRIRNEIILECTNTIFTTGFNDLIYVLFTLPFPQITYVYLFGLFAAIGRLVSSLMIIHDMGVYKMTSAEFKIFGMRFSGSNMGRGHFRTLPVKLIYVSPDIHFLNLTLSTSYITFIVV